MDAGAGDDEVCVRGVCFPHGNAVLGGASTDVLCAPSDLVEHAEFDGFEERQIVEATIGLCPDLE